MSPQLSLLEDLPGNVLLVLSVPGDGGAAGVGGEGVVSQESSSKEPRKVAGASSVLDLSSSVVGRNWMAPSFTACSTGSSVCKMFF